MGAEGYGGGIDRGPGGQDLGAVLGPSLAPITVHKAGDQSRALSADGAPDPEAFLRVLTPKEAYFVERVVRYRDIRLASLESGFSSHHGYKLVKRPQVRDAIEALSGGDLGPLASELGKPRLLADLDEALQFVSRAFRRHGKANFKCRECGVTNEVEVIALPRDVAHLSQSMARAVEVAAKITGANAPTKVQHTYQRAGPEGSYSDVVRLLRLNPAGFTKIQREEMRAAALEDRTAIDVLLSILAQPVNPLDKLPAPPAITVEVSP